jgi:hypothetical protein
MLIAKVENNTITIANYKDMFPNSSFPASGPDDAFMAANGCKHVTQFLQHDRETEKLMPCTPYIDGDIVYTVEVVPKDPAEIEAEAAAKEAARIASLWQAAHDKEFSAISGSAIGMLSIGVSQAKPKCVAVQNWIMSFWTEYYTRKANGSTDTDYSAFGDMPYSVPELITEVYGS